MNKDQRKSLWKKLSPYKYLYLMMIPGIVWLICFHLLPLYGIQIAFYDYKIAKGLSESEFVGFRNFKVIFANPEFSRLLGNTLKISFLSLIFGFPLPIILALSVNTIRKSIFRKGFQTISYLPHFLSWVIVYGISNLLFSGFNGVFSNIFASLGIKYTDPTTNADTFIAWLIFQMCWKSMGWGSIIYLAALSGVDVELYEAARIDGASRTRQLFAITLPAIAPVCGVVMILNMGGLLGGHFDQIYQYLQGNNVDLVRIAETFDIWIFKTGINGGKYGISAALDIFRSLVGIILILTTNYFAKKLGHRGVW